MASEAGDDLQTLVYDQVEMILRHDTVVDLSAVVAAIAQNIGVAPDRTELQRILDAHPNLVGAGLNAAGLPTYKRRG